MENNILYLANLKALEAWYTQVRKPFFEAQEFGSLIYNGAMDQLCLPRKERLKRFRTMAQKAVSILPESASQSQSAKNKPCMNTWRILKMSCMSKYRMI
ncbi:MAG: hypothetical protein MZV70_09850 [Desulfobacterales bacterium]|nr:hypothetical protein [Desulfobacterales bacterium]